MMLDKYKMKQKMAYEIIANEINNNELSHAYIIETNKYRYANDFIFCMLTDIYNDSTLYNQIQKKNYPDIYFMEPEYYEYKKDDVLKLEKEFNTKPLYGKYKIYVIKEANKLSKIAANSMLKFIEEPEEGTIAFLVVDNKFQLIETIVSRCQILSLCNNNKYEKTLENFFIVNNLSYETEEQVVNYFQSLLKFVICIEKFKKDAILYEKKYFTNLFKTKGDYYAAFAIMICIYKQVLNIKNETEVEYLNKHMDILNKIADSNDVYKVIDKMMIIIDTQGKVAYNLNLSLLLDDMIMKLGEL